jgi:hypothetical protein
MDYKKKHDEQHDMFFVIYVPEGYILKADIIKNSKNTLVLHGMVRIPEFSTLKQADGYYVNDHDRIISVRFPPLSSEFDYQLDYEVVPEFSERMFFTAVVTALTVASMFFFWVGLSPLYNPNPPTIMRIIYPHLFALYGGTITAALAAIGLMGKQFMGKTRFFLIAPVAISIIGFLLKELFALPP